MNRRNKDRQRRNSAIVPFGYRQWNNGRRDIGAPWADAFHRRLAAWRRGRP